MEDYIAACLERSAPVREEILRSDLMGRIEAIAVQNPYLNRPIPATWIDGTHNVYRFKQLPDGLWITGRQPAKHSMKERI